MKAILFDTDHDIVGVADDIDDANIVLYQGFYYFRSGTYGADAVAFYNSPPVEISEVRRPPQRADHKTKKL